MEYTRNAVYNKVATAINAQFEDAYCTSRYEPIPSSFPSCYIHEIDNSRPIEYTQLDFEDVQWESAFEIQVTSVKANTALTEAHVIMKIADNAFNKLYYRRFSQTSVDLGDRFTLIGRYRRHIGGGDTLSTT